METKLTLDILIVEDELLIAEMLKEMLLDLKYNVVGLASSYKEAKQFLASGKKINLCILDINLNDEKTGIDIGHELAKEHKIPFIFLTSYSDRKTFEKAALCNPEAYLIKPFTQPDLFTTLELIKIKKLSAPKTITLKDGHANIKLALEEILWIRSENIYLEIKTAKKTHILRSSMDKFLTELNDDNFIRIHRSYAVNLSHVTAISGQFVIVDGEKLPLSRAAREGFISRFQA